MDADTVLRFHEDQLDRLLTDRDLLSHPAAATSIKTALDAMKPGLFGKWSIRKKAIRTLQTAMVFRQAEVEATPRWKIASFVESLATLRLIGASGMTDFDGDTYEVWRHRICETFRIDDA